MGYKNAAIPLTFPELGDDCSVLLRNPRLLPAQKLTPADVPLNPDGSPVDPEAAQQATFEVLANVIIGWHVWDATVEDLENAPLLEDITPANIARMPVAIISEISRVVAEAAPSR